MQTAELGSIDHHFGCFVKRLTPGGSRGIFLAAALASMVTRDGHSCLELAGWEGGLAVAPDGTRYEIPELHEWFNDISSSPAVGSGSDFTPLVRERGRLYLRRYWEYEKSIVDFVTERGSQPDRDLDINAVAVAIKRLFPDSSGEECDWQGLAALAVLLRSFVVITGGPGTGKTTTITRIIALAIEHQTGGRPLKIVLTAPTGKAVMRLQAVVAGIKSGLDCTGEIKEQIPSSAMTLHRLLGPRKNSPFFKYNEKNPIPYDLVVVDEVSMVDLPLMAKLMRALDPSTRLVVLGDRHQLASVEPGAVLGDLCRKDQLMKFSSDFLDNASKITAIDGLGRAGDRRADSLIELKKSHRFGEKSGIALLGRALNEGNGHEAMKILHDNSYPDVVWREVGDVGSLHSELRNRFKNKAPAWFDQSGPEQALKEFGRSQLLCGVRRGPFGVEGINPQVEEILASRFPVIPGRRDYHGRPIMVLQNDYELELFNGDIGIIMSEPGGGGKTLAYFSDLDNKCRRHAFNMLPQHETVYAMTVHKSQGSEFDEVVVILPDHPSAVLTRELLYTAVTRARKRLEIWADSKVFLEAASSVLGRHSGLRDGLDKAVTV